MVDNGSKLAHDPPKPEGARRSAQVLPFPPGGRLGQGPLAHPRSSTESGDDGEPLDDLAQYERDRDEEDDNVKDPHRMLMNVIAVVVLAILIGAGVWLADAISYMERNQDCILQGRQNCAPIAISAPMRK